MKNRLLIIDDEVVFISKMRLAFKEYSFDSARTIDKSFSLLETNQYALILLDLNLNPSTEKLEGLQVIQPIKEKCPDTPLVVVTADEKTETVVTAIKLGADDFLRKSNFDLLAWKKKFDLLIENQRLRNLQSVQYPLVGSSPEINEIKKTLDTLADNPDITVLITGETGVGKEVAARYLHNRGKRRNKPFVAVNLSTIQESLLESTLFGHKKGAFTGAHYDRDGFFRKAVTGILFLDEIGDISKNIQIKLLRFLETKVIQVVGDEKDVQLDVQIIVATNQDLRHLVDAGTFRSDLYYRIKNFHIEIPPLRHRQQDIEEILSYYLRQAGYGDPDNVLTFEAKEKLLAYRWPGNVRELKNAVDSMLLKARVQHKKKVDTSCLPEDIRAFNHPSGFSAAEKPEVQENSLKIKLAHTELSEIEDALKKTFGQKDAAAQLLGMSADQMRYRVLKWWKINRSHLLSFPAIIEKYKLTE